MTATAPRPMLNILLARRLEDLTSGNCAFLMVLLRTARDAGFGSRIIYAPRRSFANRPFARHDPAFDEITDKVIWPQTIRIGQKYWSLSPIVWARSFGRIFMEALIRTGLDLGPLTRPISALGNPLAPAEARVVARLSDANPCDIAIAEYSPLGPLLKRLKGGPKTAVFLHDLFSSRSQAFSQGAERPDHSEMTIEEEADLVRDADLLIHASANELAKLQPHVPDSRHVWLRPDVPDYTPAPADNTPHAVFLGTIHGGNTDAMHHLVDEIWPLVLKQRPQSELRIAGSTCRLLTPKQLGTSGLKALGRVDDLSTIGGANAIGLAPTRLASGVSIKVAEYLKLGMPCIAYPIALEGFGDQLDDLVDVREGAQAFAERIVSLLNDADARETLSRKGLGDAPARLANGEVADSLKSLVGAHAKVAS